MISSRLSQKSLPSGLKGLFVFPWEGAIYLAYLSTRNGPGTFSLARSEDGFGFRQIDTIARVIKSGERLDLSKGSNFRVYESQNGPLLTFSLGKGETARRVLARCADVSSWNEVDETLPEGSGPAVFISVGKSAYFFSGAGEISVRRKKAGDWSGEKILLSPRAGKFDAGPLLVHHLAAVDGRLLLLYESGEGIVGGAVLDEKNPEKVLWRGGEVIWRADKHWQTAHFIGIATVGGQVISYWQTKTGISALVYAYYRFPKDLVTKNVSLRLEKSAENPMLVPSSTHSWEAFNTFNPAAVYLDDKVHLLYRAQGYDYVSTVGYASSANGLTVDSRLPYPIYSPRADFEFRKGRRLGSWQYHSGGGYGGVEDPRVTVIDGRVYMTYVAFDGFSPPRVALTFISIGDFLAQRWQWERAVLISPPGVVDKSAVIFPEKINGKYVIFHRIFPNILIDFVDSLDFDGNTWLKGTYKIEPRAMMWDSRKLGAGAPPLKTKAGWLLIYQAVDDRDAGRYKVGAMLLDLNDPTKVLARSKNPILEPLESYEMQGFKGGVVYPCGAVIIENRLFVYYGAADSYVAVATADLDQFLAELLHGEIVRLDPARVEKVV